MATRAAYGNPARVLAMTAAYVAWRPLNTPLPPSAWTRRPVETMQGPPCTMASMVLPHGNEGQLGNVHLFDLPGADETAQDVAELGGGREDRKVADTREEIQPRVRQMLRKVMCGGQGDAGVMGAVQDKRGRPHLVKHGRDIDVGIWRPDAQDGVPRQSEEVPGELLGQLAGVWIGDDGGDEEAHGRLEVAGAQR